MSLKIILMYIMILFQSVVSFGSLEVTQSQITETIPSQLNSSNTISLLSMSLSIVQLNNISNGGQLSLNNTDTASLIISEVLPYPNPMSLRNSGHLYYRLNKNQTLNCMVFDRFGRKIVEKTFPAGSNGGKVDINNVPLNREFFNNYPISSGVYFIIILSDGEILKRSKLAVIP